MKLFTSIFIGVPIITSLIFGYSAVSYSAREASKSPLSTKSKSKKKKPQPKKTPSSIKKKKSSKLSPSSIKDKTGFSKGWCCRNHHVFSVTSKSLCSQKGDHFLERKSKAQKLCKPETGFCYANKRIFTGITKKNCSNLNGLFSKKRITAQKDLLKNRSRPTQFGKKSKSLLLSEIKIVTTPTLPDTLSGKTKVAAGIKTGIWGENKGAGVWGNDKGNSTWGGHSGSGIWGNDKGDSTWGGHMGSGIWGGQLGSGIWGGQLGSGIWENDKRDSTWGGQLGSGIWGDTGDDRNDKKVESDDNP